MMQSSESHKMFGRLFWALMGLLAFSSDLPAADSSAMLIKRGSYLANRASLCGDCHTPRGQQGQPDTSRLFQGAPIGFQPLQPVPGWSSTAPPLAGLAGWSEAAAVKFLETGMGKNGKPADPPMPEYRFSHSDAEALVAYFRSLKAPDSKAAPK